MKVGRKAGIPLHVMTTVDERSRIDAMAKERGISLRELVVTSILGSASTSVHGRLEALEQRVRQLEERA